MEACVYIITNSLTGKQYVGVTKDMRRRMISHASHTTPTKAAIKNAIKKYGREVFKMEVLEEGTVDHCYSREPYWIERMNTLKPKGYNICTGGRGSKGLVGDMNGMFGRSGELHPHFGKPGYFKGRKHSEQTKARMSEVHKGDMRSAETREKMRKAALARSPEAKARAAAALRASNAKRREALAATANV